MPPSIPSLNWLRVFEAAARMENFARAGELLDLSTSAVSQQIKALESHFGEKLFERHPRSVELTDAGHAFFAGGAPGAAGTVEESAATLFGEERGNTLTLQADLVFRHRLARTAPARIRSAPPARAITPGRCLPRPGLPARPGRN